MRPGKSRSGWGLLARPVGQAVGVLGPQQASSKTRLQSSASPRPGSGEVLGGPPGEPQGFCRAQLHPGSGAWGCFEEGARPTLTPGFPAALGEGRAEVPERESLEPRGIGARTATAPQTRASVSLRTGRCQQGLLCPQPQPRMSRSEVTSLPAAVGSPLTLAGMAVRSVPKPSSRGSGAVPAPPR